MAASVAPLQQLRLPEGPSQITAEQRYWKTFKNQLQTLSPSNSAITHIGYPTSSPLSPPSTTTNDCFAITTGTRVQIYSIRTRKLVKTITRFADTARSGEIRKDGRILTAGEDSGRIQVFDVKSRAILKTWTQHKQPVWTTKFSPVELTTLLSASDDKTVRLWDLTGTDPTTTLVGHSDYVRCASFMPGSMANTIVSGSYDTTVKLWDPRTGSNSAVMTFKHADPVEDVLPMPSGTTLLAAASNSISVLDLVGARPLRMISNHQKTVTSLSLSSSGHRLLSAGLDAHVKVYETTGWNVVSSTKYSSPILSMKLLGVGHGPDAVDRHLVVGMTSGLLSIRTRLTGPEAAKERAREREMEALLAGEIASHDKKINKRKRTISVKKRLDLIGENADVVIANDRLRGGKETQWQRDLRHGEYGPALDQVLDARAKDHTPLNVLAVLLSLRHRGAIRAALEGRDEQTVQPIIGWVCGHIIDTRYVSVCVEVAIELLDLYSEYVGDAAELREGFRTLRRRVHVEVERAQVACQTGGMLESLMLGAV